MQRKKSPLVTNLALARLCKRLSTCFLHQARKLNRPFLANNSFCWLKQRQPALRQEAVPLLDLAIVLQMLHGVI